MAWLTAWMARATRPDTTTHRVVIMPAGTDLFWAWCRNCDWTREGEWRSVCRDRDLHTTDRG